MLKRRIFPILLSVAVLYSCAENDQNIGQNNETGDLIPLKVALAADLPGYFVMGGEMYGYFYELLDAYAQENNREIDLTTGENLTRMWNNLENNTTDLGLSLTSKVAPDALSVPLYATDYVVLGKKGIRTENKSLPEIIADGTIMISSCFTETKSYDYVLDSLSKARIYVSPKDGYELSEGLAAGEYDFIVCERSEALIAQEFIKGIQSVYEFDEKVNVSLVFASESRDLYYGFSEWFDGFKTTDDYTQMHRVYFKNGFRRSANALSMQNRVIDGISVWDDLLQKVGQKQGVDWKLLSAIAYKESRFHHNITSHRGARGLMQIMPVTARHFNVPAASLSDPEVNITLAAKLIKEIEQSLGFGAGIPADDKLSIVLAAYNCGVGTVANARKLALSEGASPDSWSVISRYLELMGNDEYASDTVSYRRFSGSGQTNQFVDGVKKRYDMYRKTIH